MNARLQRMGRAVLAALLLAVLSPACHASAGDGAALERSVKAAFLVKFLAYADYPPKAFADAGAPMVIGIVGDDEMAGELERGVAGRSINGRPLQVRSLRDNEPVTAVHLLFVAGSDCGRLARVLRQSPAGPILVVSECGNGLQTGSIINFKIIEQHVRFDVSLDAADRNNIKLSSRLLSVANHVSKGAP